jgi:hypothetical protein
LDALVDKTRAFRDYFINNETNTLFLQGYRTHLIALEALIRDAIPMLQNAIEAKNSKSIT